MEPYPSNCTNSWTKTNFSKLVEPPIHVDDDYHDYRDDDYHVDDEIIYKLEVYNLYYLK